MNDRERPTTAREARHRLDAGNRAFVESGDIGDKPGDTPGQTPFAAVIGCADARVPETIFSQGWDDIFVMRVAGNGLNAENLGSVQYAALNIPSVKIAAVVGHTACGAVTAAVDTWLDPSSYPEAVTTPQIRAIVDPVMIAARTASEYLEAVHGASVTERPGYRAALIETTIVMNAATNARLLFREVQPLNGDIEVVFGVYDIATRRVGVTQEEPGLADTPADAEGFDALGFRVAESASIAALLDG